MEYLDIIHRKEVPSQDRIGISVCMYGENNEHVRFVDGDIEFVLNKTELFKILVSSIDFEQEENKIKALDFENMSSMEKEKFLYEIMHNSSINEFDVLSEYTRKVVIDWANSLEKLPKK